MLRNIREVSLIGLLKNRFALFFIVAITLLLINYCLTGSLIPNSETGLWFYSGLLMLVLSILFIEPYYTSPKNVITNTIPLLLVFLAVKSSFGDPLYWGLAIVSLSILLTASVISISIEDKDRSAENWKNKTADFLKRVAVLFGQGKVLYSSAFIYFLFAHYSIQNFHTLLLLVMWLVIISIDPKKIKSTFITRKKEHGKDALGEIFAVQSKDIFLVKIFLDKENINRFDFVKFRYSIKSDKGEVGVGVVLDVYFLNKEMWMKVLQLKNCDDERGNTLEKNIIYKATDNEKDIFTLGRRIDDFVGVVSEGSGVGKIKFEYFEKQSDFQEGDLLELNIQQKRLFYQVTNGVIEKERLEGKNEAGLIIGEAMQLGEWDNIKTSFQKFGWVPPINTPVLKADTSDIEIQSYKYPDYQIGLIPGTTLPSVINLAEAVSHHTALLGVTGSGKSFLAQELVKKLQEDSKIICIDFTGEWKKMLNPDEVEDFSNIEEVINSNKISIIELSNVSNTTESLQKTEAELQKIFSYAKENEDCKKICLVLEEAHTIVPETSFLGDLGDYGANKALVNKMSQIALQGRKYDVGLLVIAQRTANVSKTVLTQCNTVICFQAFDETSFAFLGNYIGKDLVQTLPNLKQYHAIVTGKAMKSNLPMIIDLTRESDQREIENKTNPNEKKSQQESDIDPDDIPF